jgi:ribulose-phosphate 3-epimerase
MKRPLMTVIPGILAKNKADFVKRLKNVDGIAPLVHVDVMDGTFVKEKTWASVNAIAELHAKTAFEIHLMVNNPLPVIINWMKVKGFQRAIVHLESPVHITDIITACRMRCIEIVLAISPGTPLSTLMPHLKHIDGVQVMGGKPGKSGQPLDPDTLKTVRALRKKTPSLPIAFDIGVNRHTLPELIRAGVSRPVATSAIANAASPAAEYRALLRMAQRN